MPFLNYRDLLMVRGQYSPAGLAPHPVLRRSGRGGRGGRGGNGRRGGQRVAGIFMQNWLDGPPTAEKTRGALGGDIDGMLAEYVVLQPKGVVPIPGHLSYVEAATLPAPGVTAWNALQTQPRYRPGDVV